MRASLTPNSTWGQLTYRTVRTRSSTVPGAGLQSLPKANRLGFAVIRRGGTDSAELAHRLRRYVVRVGPERIGLVEPESATLPELVAALSSFFGIR
jgi:hypothetical protein